MKPIAIVLAGVLLGAVPFGARSATPPPARTALHWQRNPLNPRWVQGEIDVATSSTAVWNRIADVPTWPALFSDMTSFSVESKSADNMHWRVRFESRSFGHGRHDYVVTLNGSKQSGSVLLDAPGVRAVGYATVAAMGDRRSGASYSLFVETHGFVGWFISETDLRRRQERLVQRTLGDLEKAFGRAERAKE